MDKLKVLDLFSGIGGFSLGLERTGGFETVAFCEIDKFCQKVLKKHWPDVPIYEDVRSLDYDGSVDVITGGYPCQPFSVAGKRKGAEDDRHLWPAMLNLVKKHRPDWVIGENVAGFVNMALDDVLAELESEGYGCRAFIIPACAVDAKHRRDRVWVVANSESKRKRRKAKNISKENGGQGRPLPQQPAGASENVADTESFHAQGQHNGQREGESWRGCRWKAEPNVGRVANGIPGRVDRLKSLGNAVVPQIPEIIGYAILEAERENL